MLIYKLNIN